MPVLWRTLEGICLFLCAMLSGYFLAHTIVLGNFYNWLLQHGHSQVITHTYSQFRRASLTVPLYYAGFILQLAVAVLLLSVMYRAKQHQLLHAMLILPFPMLILLHQLSGFNRIEAGLLSGQNYSTHSIGRFLAMNTMIHLLDALLYAIPPLVYALQKQPGLQPSKISW